MSEITIGGPSRELLRITISSRSRPHDSDYWDGNWVNAEVEVNAGGFRGQARGNLRAEEFLGFRDEVAALAKSLEGAASFTTMEGWLRIGLKGDGKGHVAVEGELLDEPGIGNVLTFHLALDQSYLPGLLAELSEVVASFPVRGARDA